MNVLRQYCPKSFYFFGGFTEFAAAFLQSAPFHATLTASINFRIIFWGYDPASCSHICLISGLYA